MTRVARASRMAIPVILSALAAACTSVQAAPPAAPSCNQIIPDCHAKRLPNRILHGEEQKGALQSADGFNQHGLLSFDAALQRAWGEDGQSAQAEAAPFLHGSVARLLSDMVRELSNQSLLAIETRARWVTPELELQASPEILADMASYLWRRGAWLAGYASSIGIDPVPAEIEDLRRGIIGVLQYQSGQLAQADRSRA